MTYFSHFSKNNYNNNSSLTKSKQFIRKLYSTKEISFCHHKTSCYTSASTKGARTMCTLSKYIRRK